MSKRARSLCQAQQPISCDPGCVLKLERLLAKIRKGNDTPINELAVLAAEALEEDKHAAFVIVGAVPLLVDLLRSGNQSVKELAACAIRNLALDERIAAIIEDEGGVPVLLDCLSSEACNIKAHTVAALNNLARNEEVASIIARQGGLHVIMQQLEQGSDAVRAHAASTLAKLARCTDVKPAARELGAIPLLVRLLSTSSANTQSEVAFALGMLMYRDEASCKLTMAAGAIKPLISIVQAGDIGVDNALGALLNLAINNTGIARVIQAQVLPATLTLLRSGEGDSVWLAIMVLRTLLVDKATSAALLRAGVLKPLVHVLNFGQEPAQEQAAGIIEELAGYDRLAAGVAVPALIQLLQRGCAALKLAAENALAALADAV